MWRGRRLCLATYKLVLLAQDVGDVHVVGGWAELLQLLAGEDVDGSQMDLGVSVLSSLGGGHVDDLARAVLDADETVLSQGRALHWVGGGGAGIGGVEGVLMLFNVLDHGPSKNTPVEGDSMSMRAADLGGGSMRGDARRILPGRRCCRPL